MTWVGPGAEAGRGGGGDSLIKGTIQCNITLVSIQHKPASGIHTVKETGLKIILKVGA